MRPAAGDHQRPVRSADHAHRVVDLGCLVSDGCQRGAPQAGGAVAVSDAEDVESAERRRDDTHAGGGQGDGVGVELWQVGFVFAEQCQDALQCQAALGGSEQTPVIGDGMPAGGDAGFGEFGDDQRG